MITAKNDHASWVITRCKQSDYKYNCSCPAYCLHGMCKHVIRYSVDKGEFPISDMVDLKVPEIVITGNTRGV